LPDAVRSLLAGWTSAAVAGREALRPVPEASLHVTLVFLGSTPPGAVDRIWAAVPRDRRAPRFAATGLVALPRRTPRVFALGLEDEGGHAAALQQAIAEALGDAEGRRWFPHITLARVRKGHRIAHLASDPPAVDPFAATAVSLLRSYPGSRYEVVERTELGGQSS
jgi:2'-5' RNA ligase